LETGIGGGVAAELSVISQHECSLFRAWLKAVSNDSGQESTVLLSQFFCRSLNEWQ